MTTLLLRDADVLVTMDAQRREIAGGGVFIRDGVIEAVGTRDELPASADQVVSLAGCVAPGGWIAIADLESEDGSFHDEPVPHLGFAPAGFLATMQQAGFEAVSHQRVHVMQKPPGGRSYPIVLAVARRP